jgi:hypothetical protein
MNNKIWPMAAVLLPLLAWMAVQAHRGAQAREQLAASYRELDASHRLLRAVRSNHIQQVARNIEKTERTKLNAKQ